MSDHSDREEEDITGDTSEESVVESDSSSEIEGSSSDGESEDEGNGQDQHGIWVPIIGEDPGPQPIIFTAASGPKHPPPQDARPVDYVNLFFTTSFVDQIVAETNRYARKWIEDHSDYLNSKARSRVHQWYKRGNLTPEEFRAFLGVSLNMGVIRKPNIGMYWDAAHPSQSTPWFKDHFSRDRFQLLLKFLHFSNNDVQPPAGHPNHKLHKIQSLIGHFTRSFLRHYHPGMDISIDESMIGYKGRTPHLRQYMPLKRHARFGIKVWCVCDSANGYTSYFEVYKGKEVPVEGGQQCGATHALVMRLLTECNFLHRGHHLGVDNFFSSPDLFLELYANGTSATGTVRTHRRGLPRAALKQRLGNKEVVERRKGPLLCVAYKDGSKTPVLLSTAVSAGFQNVINRRGEEVRRPKVVVRYNQSMGGVDLSDARLYTYLAERRTMKWTLKVAFSLFGRAVLNSYILYEMNTTDSPKLSRHMFMVELVEALAGNYHPPKIGKHRRTAAAIEAAKQNRSAAFAPAVLLPQPQPALGGGGHTITKLEVGKRRNCAAGHDGKRVRTSYECPTCNVGLCPACFTTYRHET